MRPKRRRSRERTARSEWCIFTLEPGKRMCQVKGTTLETEVKEISSEKCFRVETVGNSLVVFAKQQFQKLERKPGEVTQQQHRGTGPPRGLGGAGGSSRVKK